MLQGLISDFSTRLASLPVQHDHSVSYQSVQLCLR